MSDILEPINTEYLKSPTFRDILVVASINYVIFGGVRYLGGLLILAVLGDSMNGLSGIALGLAMMSLVQLGSLIVTIFTVGKVAKKLALSKPFLTVMFANVLIYITSLYINNMFNKVPLVSILAVLCISVVSFLVVVRLLNFRWHTSLKIIVIILGLIILSIGGNLFSGFIFEAKEKDAHNKAVDDLDFTVYQPTYIPLPLEDNASVPQIIRPLAATGYYATTAFRSPSTESYGDRNSVAITILQNRLKPGFRPALDPPNTCDAKNVGFAIKLDKPVIDVSEVTKRPCKLYATTPKGYKIYGSNSFDIRRDDGKRRYDQFTAFYVQVNNTVTIWDFFYVIGSTYTDDFLPEFIKMVDSLEAVEPNRLKR